MIFPCACGLARPRRCDIKGKTINMELDGAGPRGLFRSQTLPLPLYLPPSLLRRCVINKAGQKSCFAGFMACRQQGTWVCGGHCFWCVKSVGGISEYRMKTKTEKVLSLSLSLTPPPPHTHINYQEKQQNWPFSIC